MSTVTTSNTQASGADESQLTQLIDAARGGDRAALHGVVRALVPWPRSWQGEPVPRLLAVVAPIFAWGCSLGSVQMDALGVSAQKPSQVAVYLRVDSGEAAPSPIRAEDFEIFEDDQRVLPEVGRQALLDRDIAAVHRSLLLIDLSTATSESVRAEIARSVGVFAERVVPTQPVSVYAFDGRPELRAVIELARGATLVKSELQRIVKMEPRDPSRNLHGAVRLGLERLDALLAGTGARLPIGTLVVFTGGGDLAGLVSESDARRALEASPHAVFTIAVSTPEQQGVALRGSKRDAFVNAHDLETFSLAFEEAAHEVQHEYERHYLLAYCSPARAGKRRLRLDLRARHKPAEKRGSLVEEFDAKGFTAGCDPRAIPSFPRPVAKSP